ncbi:NAD-dependent epimerase/dehydratase family protein [Synechococcus sp. W4D4]|uniref:NAD-dependent epimerase/dehydratase family protein n=1 Tax=Synechococcus sp. W4D4 TaxID=3392294 RepID=UPI0039ED23B2
MHKIVIAGANGFLGRNIYESFQLKYPSAQVRGLTRDTLDLASLSQVKDYFSSFKPDIVIHSAVTISDIANNIKMHHALEASSNYCGKIITLGSGAEYNPKAYKPLMKESYYGNSVPEDPYSLSKYLISRMIQSGPSNISNLRLFGIFGMYEDYTRRFISNNIVRHILGMPLQMNKDISFDYMYVPDFLSCLHEYAQSSNKDFAYNLSTGNPLKFSFILKTMCNCLGLPADSFTILDEISTDYEYSGDPGKYVQEFGPLNLTPLTQSITELYEYYLSQRDSLVLPT